MIDHLPKHSTCSLNSSSEANHSSGSTLYFQCFGFINVWSKASSRNSGVQARREPQVQFTAINWTPALIGSSQQLCLILINLKNQEDLLLVPVLKVLLLNYKLEEGLSSLIDVLVF